MRKGEIEYFAEKTFVDPWHMNGAHVHACLSSLIALHCREHASLWLPRLPICLGGCSWTGFALPAGATHTILMPLPLLTGIIVSHIRACADWHMSKSLAPKSFLRKLLGARLLDIEKTFTNVSKSAKFAKVFSLESFPLYGIILLMQSCWFLHLHI